MGWSAKHWEHYAINTNKLKRNVEYRQDGT